MPENIRLAYRNIKKNSGSKTPGTDNRTIKDLERLSDEQLITLVQRKLERQMVRILSMIEEQQIGLSYMLFDQLGFRRENPAMPDRINFNEIGMLDVKRQLSEQTKQIKKVEQIKHGRSYR